MSVLRTQKNHHAAAMKTAGIALFLLISLQLTCFAEHGLPSEPLGGTLRSSRDGISQSKDPGDSLYGMTAADFFQMKEVEKAIDFQNIDYGLLSSAIFHATNRQRQKHGKSPLGYLPRLYEASSMHARDMAGHEYVAHINPREQELRTPQKRVREAGLTDIRFMAENVASHFGIRYEPGRTVVPLDKDGGAEYSYQQGGEPIAAHTYRSFAESLVDSWMGSPGHRKNMLSEEPRYLGAACSMGEADKGPVKFYCVQLFLDRFGK